METLIVFAQSTVQVLEEVGRALISDLKLDSRSQAASRNELIMSISHIRQLTYTRLHRRAWLQPQAHTLKS